MACIECGSDVRPLLTIDGSEWDGGSGSRRPVEDADRGRRPVAFFDFIYYAVARSAEVVGLRLQDCVDSRAV